MGYIQHDIEKSKAATSKLELSAIFTIVLVPVDGVHHSNSLYDCNAVCGICNCWSASVQPDAIPTSTRDKSSIWKTKPLPPKKTKNTSVSESVCVNSKLTAVFDVACNDACA